MSPRAGICVDVWEAGEVCAMLYVGEDKGKLKVVSPKGRELKVPPSRIANVTEHSLDPAGDRVILGERLREWESELRARGGEVDLESVWEILADDGGQYELEELTELALGTRAGDACSVVLRQLLLEQPYFGRKQLSFSPHTREDFDRTVERKRAAEILGEQRSEFIERASAYRRQAQSAQSAPQAAITWTASDHRFLEALRDVAINGIASKHLRDGQALLGDLGLGGRNEPELAAFELLVELEVLPVDENLLLLKHGIVREFPDAVLAEAERMRTDGPRLDPGRRDLRALDCFAIDDRETTEVDDALSVERLGDGRTRLGVHIADPSPYVRPGSLLDATARERSTTFYLPAERILMLPTAISEDVGSLVPGQDRTALSFLVDVDATGEVLSWEIFESIIRVTRRLDYGEADELIAKGGGAPCLDEPLEGYAIPEFDASAIPDDIGPDVADQLAHAARLARAILERRAANGALILKGPDLDLKIIDGQFRLRRIEPWTPSWILVSEMMVLANWIAARVMRDAGVNAIFRRQAPPDRPIELPRIYDPAAAAAARRRIKPTDLSIHPGAHAGLGVDVYVQCTSPLRRYQDLVGHRQLKSALGQGPSLTDDELWAVIAGCSEVERAAREVERGNREYWLLRHFESFPPDTSLRAIVTRPDERRTLIELPDFAYFSQLQPRPGHKAGRELKVVVDAVNPRASRLVLREV